MTFGIVVWALKGRISEFIRICRGRIGTLEDEGKVPEVLWNNGEGAEWNVRVPKLSGGISSNTSFTTMPVMLIT